MKCDEASAISVTFSDVQNLVYKTVHQMWNRYHRQDDLLEFISEGFYYFCLAYYDYDPERASFDTWVANRVQYGLKGLKRRRARQAARGRLLFAPSELLDRVRARQRRHSPIREIIESVSKDARLVISLALHPNMDIIGEEIIRGRETPTRKRAAIRSYLQYVGWSPNRIRQTFQEIQEALRD